MAREQSIEVAARTPPEPPALDEPGEVPNRNPRLELRCLGCGYGAISAELIRCPMCGDEAWDFAEWRPFSH
jgi:rubrerythrin